MVVLWEGGGVLTNEALGICPREGGRVLITEVTLFSVGSAPLPEMSHIFSLDFEARLTEGLGKARLGTDRPADTQSDGRLY